MSPPPPSRTLRASFPRSIWIPVVVRISYREESGNEFLLAPVPCIGFLPASQVTTERKACREKRLINGIKVAFLLYKHHANHSHRRSSLTGNSRRFTRKVSVPSWHEKVCFSLVWASEVYRKVYRKNAVWFSMFSFVHFFRLKEVSESKEKSGFLRYDFT